MYICPLCAFVIHESRVNLCIISEITVCLQAWLANVIDDHRFFRLIKYTDGFSQQKFYPANVAASSRDHLHVARKNILFLWDSICVSLKEDEIPKRTFLFETTRDSFASRNLRRSQIQFLKECFKLIALVHWWRLLIEKWTALESGALNAARDARTHSVRS